MCCFQVSNACLTDVASGLDVEEEISASMVPEFWVIKAKVLFSIAGNYSIILQRPTPSGDR